MTARNPIQKFVGPGVVCLMLDVDTAVAVADALEFGVASGGLTTMGRPLGMDDVAVIRDAAAQAAAEAGSGRPGSARRPAEAPDPPPRPRGGVVLNLHRAAVLLLPSVPRRLARLVDVAAQTPVPVRLGEERAGTGPDAAPTSLGVGSRPGSAVPWHPAAFSGPPACETQVAFYPHPSRRWEFGDERLGALIDRWAAGGRS